MFSILSNTLFYIFTFKFFFILSKDSKLYLKTLSDNIVIILYINIYIYLYNKLKTIR